LGNLGHIALQKKCRLIGVQSAGEEIERHPPAVFAQSDWIAQTGEGVVIGDKVERFALFLQGDRRPHHAKVIADMQDAAGLNAGKNAHGAFHPPNTLKDAKNPSIFLFLASFRVFGGSFLTESISASRRDEQPGSLRSPDELFSDFSTSLEMRKLPKLLVSRLSLN